MNRIFTIYTILILFLVNGEALSQDDTSGSLPLVIDIDFSATDILKKFEFTDPKAWRMVPDSVGMILELFGESTYQPEFRSPLNIALLKSPFFGNFEMEIDARQTGREYNHRDLCFFFGFNDPANFYYVHLATKPDQNAHNIFLVNNEPRRPIGQISSDGVRWGQEWNKIKIVRNVESGQIQVFFNDMNNPIMEATDKHFSSGLIGIGSFDDSGRFDNLKVWGNALIPGESIFHKN